MSRFWYSKGLNEKQEEDAKVVQQLMNRMYDKEVLSLTPPMMAMGHAGGMGYGGGGSDGSMVTVYNELMQITNGTISNKKEIMTFDEALRTLQVGDQISATLPHATYKVWTGHVVAKYDDHLVIDAEDESGVRDSTQRFANNSLVFTLIKTKTTKTPMSSLLSKIRGAFEKEPEKSLKHFGFINDSGDLTDDGKEVLLNLLFKVNPEIFNEALTKLKDEEEAAKK